MSKTKMILRVPTFGKKAGETIEVDSDQAQYLADNGHAVRAKDAPTELKGGK